MKIANFQQKFLVIILRIPFFKSGQKLKWKKLNLKKVILQMKKKYSLQKWFPMVLIIIKYCSGTCNDLGDRCTSQNFMHIGKGRKNFGRVSWEKTHPLIHKTEWIWKTIIGRPFKNWHFGKNGMYGRHEVDSSSSKTVSRIRTDATRIRGIPHF